MVNNTVLAAGLAIFALGGLAFVFAGGATRADVRRASVQKSDEKATAAIADRAANKKKISDSLKDLEKKSKRKGPDLATRIAQAGLPIDKRQFLMISAGVAVAFTVLVYFKSGSLPLAGLVGLMAALGLPNLVLSRLRMRRINKFVDIFPNALDIIVRGVKAGLPLGDTLKNHRQRIAGAGALRIPQGRRIAGARPAAPRGGGEARRARAGQRNQLLLDRHRHSEQVGRQSL